MAGSASKISASPQRGKKTNTPSGTKKTTPTKGPASPAPRGSGAQSASGRPSGSGTQSASGTRKIGGPSASKTLLRFLFFCCGLAALLGLDILLTGNHLRAFAVLFGAELILYVLFLSVKMLKQGGF